MRDTLADEFARRPAGSRTEVARVLALVMGIREFGCEGAPLSWIESQLVLVESPNDRWQSPELLRLWRASTVEGRVTAFSRRD